MDIKNNTILEKKRLKVHSAHPMICLLLQVMTLYQENKQPAECWVFTVSL